MITLHNMDCMEGMKDFPDNHFELAIVDPPYGIGENWKKDTASKFYKHKSSYKNKQIPKRKFFNELFRMSKNQIIWGANYYWNFLPVTNNLIFWDKGIDPIKHLRSAGELAWTSQTKYPIMKAEFMWNGCCTCEPRSGLHPHEKPVKLYEWLLKNYAKEGDKIIDTHFGSLSSGLACHNMGFDLTAYEIDKDYFEAGKARLEQHQKQQRMFYK